MMNPKIYTDPHKFDGYRFLKMRHAASRSEINNDKNNNNNSSSRNNHTIGEASAAQSVTPSVQHPAFGYGKHACPGRFFAISEIKIQLCYILLRYDLALCQVDGGAGDENATEESIRPIEMGTHFAANPMGKIMVRRRDEDVPHLC